MSDKIKITDVLQSFDGTGDISEWWKRYETISKIKKLTIEDMAALLPLLLRESAFLIYDKIEEDDKVDLAKVKSRLFEAFSISRFAAWEKLQTRKLQRGENIDAYFAEIQRLAELAGCKDATCTAFVCGLPDSVGVPVLSFRQHQDSAETAQDVWTINKSEVVTYTGMTRTANNDE